MTPTKKAVQRSAQGHTPTGEKATGFTKEERAAMKERVLELREAARRDARADKADPEEAVLAKIASMPRPDREMAERLHAIIKATAPALAPKLWYGMPAYAKDGDIVCFFQAADKFKARYATLGFSDEAKLDEGVMWPTSFALNGLTSVEETRITTLVKRAIG